MIVPLARIKVPGPKGGMEETVFVAFDDTNGLVIKPEFVMTAKTIVI
jgi:hypothetical protein